MGPFPPSNTKYTHILANFTTTYPLYSLSWTFYANC
jgi:hypothetical protein